MIIAISEIASTLDSKASLEDRLKQAMREALDHWLVTDDREQFLSAVGAVLLTASEQEKTRIVDEMRFLQAINCSKKGIPVDWDVLVTSMQSEEPIGLMALWQQVKKGREVDKK